MSGEVSRSRQKKAGSSGGGGGKKGQQQPSNNQAAHRQYANKKKSKERQQQQKMNQKSASRFCCSAWTWILLLALTGVSVATYHQHPEKFQQVYDNLPPQVKEGLVQARDITNHAWETVSSKSNVIYYQALSMASEGYSMLPPQVREYTDVALDKTSEFSGIAWSQVKEGYNQLSIVIQQQYKIHSPTLIQYWEQSKVVMVDYGGKALDHGWKLSQDLMVIVQDTYEKVSPHAKIYAETAKEYGKIAVGKTADLILDGVDLAYDGYLAVKPHLIKAGDKTKEVLGPYVGPYVGPYWEIFYNQTVESYRESLTLARTWSRQINIGEMNLEKILFAQEIEEEKVEMAKQAAEKIKAAVEAMNKKMEAEVAAKKAAEQAEAKKKAEEERLKAEAEAKKKAEEQRLKAEAEALKKAEAEAKKRAEEEARKKAEEQRLKAEAEAKKKAEEQRLKAEAEAKLKAEAEAKKKAEEAKLKAEAEAKKKAEDARLKAEAEAKQKAEAEAKKKAEAEAQKKAEEARLKAEADAKQKAQEEAKKKSEQEAKKKAEEAKLKAEAEAKKKAEEEAKHKAETEAKKKAEEARLKAEAEAKKKAEEEAKLKAEKEAKLKAEEEKKKLEAETARRKAEEDAKLRAKREAEEKLEEVKKKANLAQDDKAVKKEESQNTKQTSSKKTTPLETLSIQLETIAGLPNNDANKEALLNELHAKLDTLDQASPMTMFIKAGILHQLAEVKRSNPILERSIHFYRQILHESQVDDHLFKLAGDKCIELMTFRGWNSQAISIWQLMVARFPHDLHYQRRLGVALLTVGNNDQAKAVFNQIIETQPNDNFAKAHLGFILKSDGADNDDQAILKQAAKLLDEAVEADVKVELEGLFYFHLGDAYRRLGQSDQADTVYKLATARKIFPSFWQRSLYNEPDLKAQPVWTMVETGIHHKLAKIRRHWEAIRDEALAVYDAQSGGFFVEEQENLKDTGYWGQYDLFVQGRQKTLNCAKTPRTCSLISEIPEIANNRRGQVKFSVMKSGTHVHAHSGPTNCRLRAHLGLRVPVSTAKDNLTVLRVADQYLHWSDGEMLIFDDSFDHEVWHFNEEPRIILIMDLWHPELSAEKRASLPAI